MVRVGFGLFESLEDGGSVRSSPWISVEALLLSGQKSSGEFAADSSSLSLFRKCAR